MAKERTDTRDIRSGAYDPVSIDGLPQPDQVRDKTTPHEQQQWGADVRAEALPGTAPVLPEGLRRPRGKVPSSAAPDVDYRTRGWFVAYGSLAPVALPVEVGDVRGPERPQAVEPKPAFCGSGTAVQYR
jgi:hypothetical protein